MSIKIIIDSSSDINQLEANKLGITMIPMEIQFDDKIYYDGVDLLPNIFYEKLIESDTLPKTSQINPFRFETEFNKIIEDGNKAIVITLSSKLSGTYYSAQQVACKERFKDNIFVIDSLNASLGIRLLTMYALELINKGLDVNQIVSLLNEKKSKIKLLAMLDTLKYLRKGGRISSLVALSGEILSIKPVVSIIDGEVKLVGKARGSKNGKNLLNKLVEESNGIDFSMPYGAIYSGFDDYTIKKYIEDSKNIYQDNTDSIPIYSIGCTIGTHIGPGGIGVAFFTK